MNELLNKLYKYWYNEAPHLHPYYAMLRNSTENNIIIFIFRSGRLYCTRTIFPSNRLRSLIKKYNNKDGWFKDNHWVSNLEIFESMWKILQEMDPIIIEQELFKRM